MRTAEAVTPKHPDKMCDQISDAILDAYLTQDPTSRVAVEVMGGHGRVYITGEVTSTGTLTGQMIEKIVHRVTGNNEKVDINIFKQSPEIAQGVDTGGAGDQGIMVGYACNDNEEMIPQELYLTRSLAKFIYEKYPYDGKTQITLNDQDQIQTVVASFQNVPSETLRSEIEKWLIKEDQPYHHEMKVHANPAGDWNQGGFEADTGLTGRKLMVDNYGPQISIGGGCFSGKDATKVDRSAAYMARKIAVDYLKKNPPFQGGVTVKLAYAIGVAEPVMATVQSDGFTEEIKGYDLTPKGIIEALDLRKPQFEETARWGHFGNGFKWDK